jgi:transcriptional regulator with XRE-family HTH domain
MGGRRVNALASAIDQTAVVFGRYLRDLRERAGMTQEELGEIVDKDKTTIARIESGGRKPPREVSFYERLKHVPGISPDDLAALLRTDNAPRWLVQDDDERIKSVPIRSDEGLVIELRVRPGSDQVTDEELEDLITRLVKDIKLRLELFQQAKERRQLQRSHD